MPDTVDAWFNKPDQRNAEVIVAHRLGYWYPDAEGVSADEIQEADDYLEAHIQWRIQQALGGNDA